MVASSLLTRGQMTMNLRTCQWWVASARLCTKGGVSFCLCNVISISSVRHLAVCSNANSIINRSYFVHLWRRFPRMDWRFYLGFFFSSHEDMCSKLVLHFCYFYFFNVLLMCRCFILESINLFFMVSFCAFILRKIFPSWEWIHILHYFFICILVLMFYIKHSRTLRIHFGLWRYIY